MMARVRTLWLSILVVSLGCTPRPSGLLTPEFDASTPDAGVEADGGPDCFCAQWGNPRSLGALPEPVVELSGLVASRSQPGIFFAHNDSGDSARFFALSTGAEVIETYTLPGATAVDWEDIALGPCAVGTCLYLGDIGDNRRVRSDYAVYAVAEPLVAGDGGTRGLSFERISFSYPGGAKHNAEALFAHPHTGRLYLVTKEDSAPSEVYRFPLPLDPAQPATLELVARLSVPASTDRPLTGADVNPCGTAILLRMYNRLVELRLPAGESDFDRIFSQDPHAVPSASEPQGEAVAYGPDGKTYFTASEKLVESPPLYEYRCR
jgi:hypothetical protein